MIVQHRDIEDPDTGAKFTVKRYRSEKSTNESSWKHEQIVLRPESTDIRYRDIEIQEASAEEMRIIGQYVATIG